uniref:THAP-type domain-containing protein n=1 Tax=Stomoxys calcitrans TaxID=35570 RepID=A0A1I8P9W7_STOCA
MSSKCVMNCKGFNQLFAFPEDDKELKRWCDVLELDKLETHDRLCDLHFDAKYIGIRGLRNDAFPESPKTKKRKRPNAIESLGIIDVSPDNDATGFETIYIATNQQTPKKIPTIKCYERKTHSQRRVTEELKVEEKKTHEKAKVIRESAKANELLATYKPGFEPVKSTFQSPPKRTYSHAGGKAKTPKLDITMTCYCRCHNREGDEKYYELLKTIENLKKTEEEQNRQINMLTSQNKLSEHLLKTKTKRLTELAETEVVLRKELETLQRIVNVISKREITAAPTASENSITFARMACARRKKYTRSEILLAQKIYSVSNRCYNFMRGVLLLNLPHTSTILRQRKLKDIVNNQGDVIEEVQHDYEIKQEEDYEHDLIAMDEDDSGSCIINAFV